MTALKALLDGEESPLDESVPEGKVLLVAYILDCIGKLSADEQASTLAAAERHFGSNEDWKERAREEFGFTAALDPFLVNIWESNRKTSERNGLEADPLEFAVVVVRENFVRDDDHEGYGDDD